MYLSFCVNPSKSKKTFYDPNDLNYCLICIGQTLPSSILLNRCHAYLQAASEEGSWQVYCCSISSPCVTAAQCQGRLMVIVHSFPVSSSLMWHYNISTIYLWCHYIVIHCALVNSENIHMLACITDNIPWIYIERKRKNIIFNYSMLIFYKQKNK